MRLREMAVKVETLLPKLNPSFTSMKNGTSNYVFHKYQDFVDVVLEIAELGFIDVELEQLKQMTTIYSFRAQEADIQITSDLTSALAKLAEEVKKKCYVVLEIAAKTLSAEDSESIDVKLPEFNNLKEASRFFNDLNNALEIVVVNKYVGGKVELQGFESGSMWITIALGTPIAVKLIGQIVSAAFDMRAQYHQTEQLKAATRSLDAVGDAQKILLDALDKQVDELFRSRATDVLEHSTIEDRGSEYTGKFLHAVTTITELIYQGTQIHPSLMGPKENKESFPTYPKLQNDEIKQLKEAIEEPTNDN